jgi:hypothetical protein
VDRLVAVLVLDHRQELLVHLHPQQVKHLLVEQQDMEMRVVEDITQEEVI